MNLEPRILQPDDLEQLYRLEKSKIKQDSFEDEMKSWSASWRKESLEHYLPLGWSYCLVDDEGQYQAYVLAQPQLFVHGLTQNLWIEHLYFETEEAVKVLFDIIYRTCREKHFQSLRLKEQDWAQYLSDKVSPLDDETNVYTFKTAKL